MHEDDPYNGDMEDDELSEDLREFTPGELADLYDSHDTGADRAIAIEERTISSLAEIIAIANKHQSSISFEECVFKEVEIDSTNLDLCIDESVFAEEVYFKKGIFGGKLTFWDTAFQKKADFALSIFKKEIRFEDCTFHNRMSFAGVTFEKGAAFVSCVFNGDIVFDHAKFAGEVDFSASTFKKGATFKGTRFSQVVNLSHVEFKEGVDTTDSNLLEMKKAPQARKSLPQQKRFPKQAKHKAEFNPWEKLDQASKKSVSRRQVLRGIFRFLPEKEEK